MLADADVLGIDAHDSVGRDSSRDPLLTAALGMSQLMPDLSLGRAESTLGRQVAHRLVRTLGVVVAHPLIERFLCRLQIPEDLPGVELDSEAAMKALDLARGGRRAGLGEDVVDAVLPADPVEEDLDRRLGEAAGEDLAVGFLMHVKA